MSLSPSLRGLTAAALLTSGALACASETTGRFRPAEPLWVDPDENALAQDPTPYFSGQGTDFADQVALRPLARIFTFPLAREAKNVNSLDEVPNSSWFTNRIGWFPMSEHDLARGACRDTPTLDPAAGPWSVVSSKSDGGDIGFTIRAPDGRRYLLKLDGDKQPPQPTTGDVVGSRIYYAAGYNTPCNEIVTFPQSVLQIAPGAKHKTSVGSEEPFTQAHLDKLLGAAVRRPDGWLRAMASRFVDGAPIGPFRYEGTRGDDPNDVVPHEDRRELRGARLFAAWLNHVDSREQNTLDTIVEEGGRRFVRHHFIDWSDTFGSIEQSDAVSRRVATGLGGYMDLDQVFVDLVTLGLTPREWNHVALSPVPETFGYWSADHFAPLRWRPGYPNPAFLEMTDRDALWAARIIARFTDEDLRAIVAEARMKDATGDARAEVYLLATLIARRDIILRDVLLRGSPLANFTFAPRGPGEPALCFEDLALSTKVADAATTLYKVRLRGGPKLDRVLGWRHLHVDPAARGRTCLTLPLGGTRPADLAGAGAPDDAPLRYARLEIYSNHRLSRHATEGIALHVVDLGPDRGFRLVGVERLAELEDPP
jgi:hypothetical protein